MPVKTPELEISVDGSSVCEKCCLILCFLWGSDLCLPWRSDLRQEIFFSVMSDENTIFFAYEMFMPALI